MIRHNAVRGVLSVAALWAGAQLCPAQEFRLDSPVGTIEATDLKGGQAHLETGGAAATVVIFISTQCPISNGYNERMNALYKDYSQQGVRFFFLNANRTEDPAEVERHAKANGFAFAVYKDDRNQSADRFGAQVTPEAYVMDRGGVLRYHGAIDDSPSNEARVTARPLRAALDAMLAGQGIPRKEMKAMGCTIKRVRKAS